MRSGAAWLSGQSATPYHFYFGSLDPDVPTFLQLANSSAAVDMSALPSDGPLYSYTTRSGEIEASGYSSLTVNTPSGRVGDEQLNLTLDPNSVVLGTMTLQDNADVEMQGDGALNNANTTLADSSETVDVAVIGQGVFDASFYSTLHFGGEYVAPSQTVKLAGAAHLILDATTDFHALVQLQDLATSGRIDLHGVNAADASFSNDMLTLSKAGVTTATLRMTDNAGGGGFEVESTPNGVSVLPMNAYPDQGGTIIARFT
ncbi:MAG: hypothetical protein JO227_08895 [Acetobacteraceae bacterium]|nr:hypothetical protein [Acetobacteraceae bacterium]